MISYSFFRFKSVLTYELDKNNSVICIRRSQRKKGAKNVSISSSIGFHS